MLIVFCLPFLLLIIMLKKRDKIIIEQDEKYEIEKGYSMKDKILAKTFPYDFFPESQNLEPILESIDI